MEGIRYTAALARQKAARGKSKQVTGVINDHYQDHVVLGSPRDGRIGYGLITVQ